MIEVSQLTKLYGSFAAVSDLSFTVQPGQLLGLVGPNGAGKTTCLRCLAGIIPLTRGNIRLAGCDLATDSIAAKRQLAFFADEPRLFEYLTVAQHLAFVARIYGVKDADARAPRLLEELELSEKKDSLPNELSRGMKQKVALACGLIHSPKVILFDEPLTGLDPLAIRRTKETIRQLARDGASVIISSHLLHLLEEICTHILVVKRGILAAFGSLQDVRDQFARGDSGVDLEEVFMRIATQGDTPPPPSSDPAAPPPLT
ncbi:MAG: ABC transporter ATP-binding protein [Pedosphaera sp.]|nr:ABC transporter ATP-binding protein [Pedosphaera sp.]